MTVLRWSSAYSVGGVMIDSHHKKLIEYINTLDEVIGSDRSTGELLNHIIYLLRQYTNYHFSLEEKFMQENNYPEYKLHKSEHDEFIKEIETFSEIASKGVGALDLKVTNYLKTWLLSHIMTSDLHYSEYFKSRGVAIP